MSKFAWVTLATNDSYSLGALVVAHSLKRVHTAHQLAVLITPGVSEAMKTKLRSVFNIVQEVNLLDSKDAANLALLKRPELGITFTKLHCWRLTQFEKCVFLDADTLVLQNCDELFEREELSAAPDVGWPDCFNSGVFVFRPNLETYASLVQFAVDKGSFDGGDQGLLNLYFSDWAHKDIAKHLPFVYNTSSVASYSYLPAFKQFGQNTKILHFIGTAKPWLQNFDSETRQVHVPGGYQHLASFLQYWWDIFADDVHGRLSTEMQHMFSHWIKPSNKVSGGYGGYRSTGTLYLNSGSGFSDGGGGDGNNNYNYSHGNDQHQHQHQQSVRNEFIPSYDAPVEYVDPWEEYLRKQAEEQEQRAREQRKREEERLYFEYLDNKRNHERWLREQEQQHSHHAHVHHSHHESSEHSGHHQDANVFQRTDQWVEHAQRHDQAGHWQPDDQHFSSNYSGDGGGGGGGGYDSTHFDHSQQHQQESHHHHHHHQQQQHDQQQQHYHEETQQQQQQHQHHHQDDAHRSVDTSDHHHHEQEAHQQQQQSHGDGSGLAGALAQLHLGEPKSEEQAAYEEHMRRQCWESGNIDYMGRDSFENIWRRITQTLSGSPTGGEEQQPAPPPAGPAPMRPISPGPGRLRKSRSRSTTPKRDGRDRSPTPTPEVAVAAAAEKKEGN